MTEHETLAAALVAALSELTVIGKGRTANAGAYSYDYAALEDVVSVTRPVLSSHGLVALTPIHDHGNGLACTVKLVHTSGQEMDLGPFPFPHGRDAQATGSMVTYHRRYSLLAALGMAAGDDDDDGAKATAAARQEPLRRPEPVVPVASAADHEQIRNIIAVLNDEQTATFRAWYSEHGFPPIKSADRLTEPQAQAVLTYLDALPADGLDPERPFEEVAQ